MCFSWLLIIIFVPTQQNIFFHGIILPFVSTNLHSMFTLTQSALSVNPYLSFHVFTHSDEFSSDFCLLEMSTVVLSERFQLCFWQKGTTFLYGGYKISMHPHDLIRKEHSWICSVCERIWNHLLLNLSHSQRLVSKFRSLFSENYECLRQKI